MSILNVNKLKQVEEKEEEEEEEEVRCCPLHGDILELVLSHVPLIDLVPASSVSYSWSHAVSSSLLHLNTPKPWLLLHSLSRNSSSKLLAFDPLSHLWMHLTPPPSSFSPIRSSHPAILYTLTPSSFSFSHDPFNLSWHHHPPPKVWRVDPVVALVGSSIVVAGGACDFEDDPLAVEVLDVDTGEWTSCGSMPEQLMGSSSSHWLSISADNDRMYMTERSTGRTYTYRPDSREWSGPHELLLAAPDVFQVALGCVDGGGMIVVGVIGQAEEVGGVKLWEVETESWEMREIGEMGKEMVEGLKDKSGCIWSIGACGKGRTGYVYNQSGSEGVVRWEMVIGYGCGGEEVKWELVRNEAAVTERVMLRCKDVGIDDLRRAASFGLKFTPMQGR